MCFLSHEPWRCFKCGTIYHTHEREIICAKAAVAGVGFEKCGDKTEQFSLPPMASDCGVCAPLPPAEPQTSGQPSDQANGQSSGYPSGQANGPKYYRKLGDLKMCRSHVETHDCRICGRGYDEVKLLIKCNWAWENGKDFGQCSMGTKPTTNFLGGECPVCRDEREAIERAAWLEEKARVAALEEKARQALATTDECAKRLWGKK